MTFDNFGLSPDILRAVSEQGYEIPTPIQDQAIPLVLAGRDMMGRAQTGTGKTAAFALPMLERLRAHANTSFSPARHPVRALILAPTRELAVQVHDSFRTYGKLRAAAQLGRLRRRADRAADQGAARRRRDPRRHARPPARPRRPAHRQPDPGRHPRPRRGRPDARHGLPARHPAHRRDGRQPQADAALLGHVLDRDPQAGRDAAQQSGLGRHRAAVHVGRVGRAGRLPGRQRPQEATCWPSSSGGATCTRCSSSRAPS